MQNDRPFRIVVIIALVISIVGLSIAYSTYEATLNIDTNTYVYNETWSIVMKDIKPASLTGNAKELSAPVITSTSINLNIALYDVNDEISYKFNISNTGTVKAKLNALPTINGIPDELKDNITFTITHADGTALEENEVIEAGNSTEMKISVKYLSKENVTNTNFNISSIFLYVQG